MAPNLSGIDSCRRGAHRRTWSSWRSTSRSAHLKPDGALVCKVFHGSGYSQLVELFKQHFRVVKPIKPKASRDKSSETFLVGIGLKTTRETSRTYVAYIRRKGRMLATAARGECARVRSLTRLKSAPIAVRRSGHVSACVHSLAKGASVNNQWFSKVAVWLVIALVLFTVFKQFDRGAAHGQPDRLLRLPRGGARQAHQERDASRKARAAPRSSPSPTTTSKIRTTATYLDRGLVGDLINNDVKFDVKPREEPRS